MKNTTILKAIALLICSFGVAQGSVFLSILTAFIAAKIYPTHTLNKENRQMLTSLSHGFTGINAVLCLTYLLTICFYLPTAKIDYNGFVFVMMFVFTIVSVVGSLIVLIPTSKARTITYSRISLSILGGAASLILLWGLSMQMNNAFNYDYLVQIITFTMSVLIHLLFVYKELIRFSLWKAYKEIRLERM